MIINDGTGKGNSAKVDGNNRMHTQAVSASEGVDATDLGRGYNINTGYLAITADATLLYIKNNDAGGRDLVVEAVALGTDGAGTAGTSRPYLTMVRNPTGGDLITDATAVSMNQNRNFSSSDTLTADIYSGKVAGTVTGGSDIAILQASDEGRDFYTINFVLPKGASMGIKYTANLTGGTSQVYCAAVCYLRDNESVDA
jgi:hypothetical protein